MSDSTRNPQEEMLLARFASGEIDAGEYQRLLGILKGEGNAFGRGKKSKLLAAGLAAAALLAVGAGTVYAQDQGSSMMGKDDAQSGADGGGTGGMMNGGRMGSMMGSQGGMGSMMDGGGSMSAGVMGSFDEEQPVDLRFIDGMTMHHEGAIMSSEHMISDSERPELRRLAENIRRSQSEQIERMQEWRGEWYPDAGQTSGMPAGMMGEMMGDGMMEQMMGDSMQETMGSDATDEMFLRMMIPHHQMAVDMAEKALTEADHPELEELARAIRDEQSAEIELMKGHLKEIEASTEGREGPKTEAGESHHEN